MQEYMGNEHAQQDNSDSVALALELGYLILDESEDPKIVREYQRACEQAKGPAIVIWDRGSRAEAWAVYPKHLLKGRHTQWRRRVTEIFGGWKAKYGSTLSLTASEATLEWVRGRPERDIELLAEELREAARG